MPKFQPMLRGVSGTWTEPQTFEDSTIFAHSIDITGSTGLILENDETITNSTNGLISLSGNLAIPDGGTIGTATDTDAITIASAGAVTFSQGITSTAASNTLGATSFNDANITNVGDIALDSISSDATANLKLNPHGSFAVEVAVGMPLLIGSATRMTSPSASRLQVIGVDDPASSIMIGRFSGDGNGSTIYMVKGRDGIATTTTVLSAEDQIGSIEFMGVDHSSEDFYNHAARIVVNVDGTPGNDGGGTPTPANDMPGRMTFWTTADGSASPTERIRIDSSGRVFIGDSANANMTTGLTINQATNNNQAFTLKASDVTTRLTDAPYSFDVETDDYFVIGKNITNQDYGGVSMMCLAEPGGGVRSLDIEAYGGTANTGKDTAGVGLVNITVTELDSATPRELANITSNGNIFSVRALVGGSRVTRFMVDEDGDLFAANATVATFDEYDDVALASALDFTSREGFITTEWEDFTKYNEQALVDAGILGALVADGGLVNVTQLQRMHNGAIRQLGRANAELKAELADMRGQLAALGA